MTSNTRQRVEAIRKARSDAFKVRVYDTVVLWAKIWGILLLAMLAGGISDPRL